MNQETVFKVGQRVFEISYGWGEIVEIHNDKRSYPLLVKFDTLEKRQTRSFTSDGRYSGEMVRTLSFTHYSLENGGFSQVPPPYEPKHGELVLFSNLYSHKAQWFPGIFHEKDDEGYYYGAMVGEDGNVLPSKKWIRVRELDMSIFQPSPAKMEEEVKNKVLLLPGKVFRPDQREEARELLSMGDKVQFSDDKEVSGRYDFSDEFEGTLVRIGTGNTGYSYLVENEEGQVVYWQAIKFISRP